MVVVVDVVVSCRTTCQSTGVGTNYGLGWNSIAYSRRPAILAEYLAEGALYERGRGHGKVLSYVR